MQFEVQTGEISIKQATGRGTAANMSIYVEASCSRVGGGVEVGRRYRDIIGSSNRSVSLSEVDFIAE